MTEGGAAVVVELPDGRRVPLRLRAAELVCWLADHEAEVNAHEYGQLRFDYSPGDTKPYLGRAFPSVKRRR